MTRTATNKPLLDKTDALISHTELDLYATDEQNDVTLNICQWICSCFYTYISVTTARMKVNNTCCELSCNERQEVKWPQKVNTASCIWKIGWRRSFHTFNQWSRSSSLVWQRAAVALLWLEKDSLCVDMQICKLTESRLFSWKSTNTSNEPITTQRARLFKFISVG